MEREEIINQLKKYFKIQELVCTHCYQKWGERSWQFLDDKLLECLLILRKDILQRPMNVNNYTQHSQRGLRCNKCSTVSSKASVYLSAHIFGKAVDFTVTGMTAAEARKKIMDSHYKIPYRFRLEKEVTWVHFDVFQTYGTTDKCTVF